MTYLKFLIFASFLFIYQTSNAMEDNLDVEITKNLR